MAVPYTITITNNSGDFKDYALFSAMPKVRPAVPRIGWSNVFAVAHAAPGQSTRFTIHKQYYAVAGNLGKPPVQDVTGYISDSKAVTLGRKIYSGWVVNGTSIEVDALSGIPYFTRTALRNGGELDAFEIRPPANGSSFTMSQAMEGRYMIGLGLSLAGGSRTGPIATIMLEPNATYQIVPTETYYVTFSGIKPGQPVDLLADMADTIKIDFRAQASSPNIAINHDKYNHLSILEQLNDSDTMGMTGEQSSPDMIDS